MDEEKALLKAIEGERQRDVTEAVSFLKKSFGEDMAEHFARSAKFIADRGLGREAIVACLLQTTIAEGKAAPEEIEQRFGKTVALLVKEASEIQQILQTNYSKMPAETLSSLVLSISTDFQTIMIKIAEVLDLLQHTRLVKKENIKQLVAMAREIYMPLAMKLGISGVDWRLQDYCFKIENPDAYEKIKKLVNKPRTEREKLLREVQEEVIELLKGKLEVQVSGRPKGFKSIFEKLKKTPFKEMHDLYGVRIICNKEKECYEALGYVHSKYQIIPEAFDDYISRPKSNGYKGIHTAVKRGGDTIEFQIRTWTQHLATESSLYWEYKRLRKDKTFEKELSWERQLVEWQKSLGADATRKAFAGKKIFVFTPKNEVITLPVGATALDFAFAVHTEVGKRAEKAKINGIFASLDTKLKNLERIEIITAEKTQAKKGWLNEVITDKAKTKIKALFGMKGSGEKKKAVQLPMNFKKIKLAECCHPLPGEDVIGVRTTKRKIIVHKKDCINIKKLPKNKLIEIGFEREKGKTEIRVTGVDRMGLLAEILNEIKKSGVTLISTNFKIKTSGYVEAIFGLEVGNVAKLDSLMEKIERINSVHGVERK